MRVLCIICNTIRTTTFLKLAQEVFLRGCSVSCLVTRSKSNQPAIRKRGNWNDSFADFYNLQRYVLGVMSQQQRREVCLRQDKKNLITDPFQTVATIDLTIKFWIFRHNTQYGNFIQLAHYHFYTISELPHKSS